MNSHWILTAICLFGCGSLFAENKVLFSADFEQDRTLKGWVSSINPGETPPDTAFGVVASEVVDGKINYFYRGLNNSFGVSAILNHPYRVGKDTVSIEIRLRVRCNGDASPVSLDLSSRESPVFPFQFSTGKGSGFGVAGYQHANEVNKLYFYKDTDTPTSYCEKKPFVPNEKDWHTWRLVYDHVASTLALFVDDAAEPTVVQKDVKLGGFEFRSLWFMGTGAGADYDDITVSVVEKEADAKQAVNHKEPAKENHSQ